VQTGEQYLPTDEIPKFHLRLSDIPQGQYAAKIFLDDPDQSKFPIGAHGFIRAISDYEMRAGSEANDSAGWRQLRRNTGSAKMTKTSPDTSNGSARVETTVVGLFRARGQKTRAIG
jgi:hypothetical protein